MSGGQAGNKRQDRQTNKALSSRRKPYAAKKKITSPPNEWCNIPFHDLKIKSGKFEFKFLFKNCYMKMASLICPVWTSERRFSRPIRYPDATILKGFGFIYTYIDSNYGSIRKPDFLIAGTCLEDYLVTFGDSGLCRTTLSGDLSSSGVVIILC